MISLPCSESDPSSSTLLRGNARRRFEGFFFIQFSLLLLIVFGLKIFSYCNIFSFSIIIHHTTITQLTSPHFVQKKHEDRSLCICHTSMSAGFRQCPRAAKESPRRSPKASRLVSWTERCCLDCPRKSCQLGAACHL